MRNGLHSFKTDTEMRNYILVFSDKRGFTETVVSDSLQLKGGCYGNRDDYVTYNPKLEIPMELL